MTQDLWNKVDGYLNELLIGDDPVLEAALEDSRAAGLPEIQVAPNQGKLLHMLARAIGARRILEIGTLAGYSTIWMGRALEKDGRLITLEYEAKHADVARRNLSRAGLDDRVEVRVGKALDLLPGIEKEKLPPFDLTFIDADKQSTTEYFEWALRLSRRGSLIVVDNVVRKGEVANPESNDDMVLGMRRFFQRLAAETRVAATAIQTVGVKEHDGLAIALVTEAPR
ncbi:MAG TPA: O-methyltransferase [Candidatus Eisenbacteria bacterium]|nr:O-methyltransferase [Candidatus Eisenbacteria bacterium]